MSAYISNFLLYESSSINWYTRVNYLHPGIQKMSEKQNLTEFNSFDTEKKVGPLKNRMTVQILNAGLI